MEPAQPVEPVTVAAPKKRGRPKGSTKDLIGKVPPKQPVTYAPPPPEVPPEPSYPRMGQDELQGMLSEFFHTTKSQRRDARMAMYRSWLGS